jgi:hypothetical protein
MKPRFQFCALFDFGDAEMEAAFSVLRMYDFWDAEMGQRVFNSAFVDQGG